MWGGGVAPKAGEGALTRHVAWVVRDHLGSIHAYRLRGTAKMPLMMTVAVGRAGGRAREEENLAFLLGR